MTEPVPTARPRVSPLQVVIAVAVGAACLGWVFSRLDFAKLLEEIGDFDGRGMLGLVVCYLGIFVMRARRAQMLLPAGPTFGQVVPIVAVGFWANAIVPFRLGVLVRPVLLERHLGIPFGIAITGAVAERLIDVVVLLALVVVATTVGAPPGGGLPVLVTLRWTLLAGAIVGLVGFAAVALMPPEMLARLLAPVEALGGAVAKLVGLVQRVGEGVRTMWRSPWRTLEAIAWSAGMWLSGMAAASAILSAFPGPWVRLPALVGFWTSVMTAAASSPTPASVGPFEAAGTMALVAYGYGAERAAAGTMLMHIGMFGMNMAIGLFFFLRMWTAGRAISIVQPERAPLATSPEQD